MIHNFDPKPVFTLKVERARDAFATVKFHGRNARDEISPINFAIRAKGVSRLVEHLLRLLPITVIGRQPVFASLITAHTACSNVNLRGGEQESD